MIGFKIQTGLIRVKANFPYSFPVPAPGHQHEEAVSKDDHEELPKKPQVLNDINRNNDCFCGYRKFN